MFVSDTAKAVGEEKWNQFLNAFVKHREEHGGNYIEVVQSLPPDVSKVGTQWLDTISGQAGKALLALKLFKTNRSILT